MKESIIEKLQKWRNEDHEDNITLNRNQICNLLEEWDDLLYSRQELYKLVMM